MTTDSFSFTIAASVDDPDGRTTFDDMIIARAQHAAVQSLVADGVVQSAINYDHTINDQTAGSGTGDDFDLT